MRAETRYTKSGDVHIAYQVTGTGPLDLVFVPGFVSHLEADWESPARTSFLERLGTFARLIRFDKRGTGLSDRVPVPGLEQRMDDVRAVMDAVGSERAALFGISDGGPMSLLFAATYPERTVALSIYGSYARRLWAPDHPIGWTETQWDGILARLEREWGGPVALDVWAPSVASDERYTRAWASYLRLAASPGAALDIMRMNAAIDVRHVLPAIRVPTLILHRTGDRLTSIEQARYLGHHIAGAKLVELPGIDHIPTVGDTDVIADEIEEFLTGVRHGPEPDRVLATVLFTDIVEATERAAALGDRRWRDLLERHHAAVRRELTRFRGRELDTAGDGFLATFDGPARAVRCACAIAEGVRSLGLEVRAGLHTGECEVMGDKLGGLAVHIGARVAALAGPGEVLVSSTVKDLVAGSGLAFQDRGAHGLKGVPGQWAALRGRRGAGRRVKRLCVFCGSAPGRDPIYRRAAETLAAELLRRRVGLVYGGGSVGLMGVLSDAVLAGGGEVVGVIPHGLASREQARGGLTEQHVVGSMHERKALMASLADGFLALPGGLGTLEEILEVLTWSQLGIHLKPVGLLEVAGYWDGLRALLVHAVREGFVRPDAADLLLVGEDPIALLDRFATWRPPDGPRAWLDATET